MAEVQAQALVAVGVVISVGGIGFACCVDARTLFQASGEVEAGAVITARQANIALPGLVAAGAQVQTWLQAGFVCAAGENLDYPTDGITAVDG
ncbi:hypothetical protein D3C84_1029630 [compost metagenome]